MVVRRLVRCHRCLVIFGTVSGSRLCLHCRAQAEPAQPQAEEAAPLKILGMKPVGNYAYSINFSDGHDTGIYSFTTLLELGEVVEAATQ